MVRADHLAASWSTTSSKLGYVERVPDPEDRRAKLIYLTKRGKEAQRFGFAHFAELEERWAERFGSERLAKVRETLEEVAASEAPEAVPELAQRSEPVTA